MSQTDQIIIEAVLAAYNGDSDQRSAIVREDIDSEDIDSEDIDSEDIDSEDIDSADSFEMPERFIVRIGAASTRLAAGVDPTYRGQLVEEDGKALVRFVVPPSAISGTRFRYQLGYTPSTRLPLLL